MASPPSAAAPPSSLHLLPSTPFPRSPSSSPSPSPSPSLKPDPLLLKGPDSKSSPPKKSPPLPWQHQETLALIQAYQEKWYSLKKGQLKAFQWEEVAVTVAARCGFDEPSKTATQCRHKIEKLRKRYRSEFQKPYPSSWQYFEPMDSMERGPLPLNARPIAIVKASLNNANNIESSNNTSHNYGTLYSGSADHYYHNIHGDGIRSDESDEEWNLNYGVEAAKKNKSKSINNIVRSNVKSGNRSAKRVIESRDFHGGNDPVVRVLRNPVNGKRKRYYDGDDSNDDDDDNDDNYGEGEDGMVEEELHVEEEGDDSGGIALAAEITGFAEMFMRMENKKIEMMRETERYRMEMEKKRMEMILAAQRKIIDSIGKAFVAYEKGED